MFTVQMDTVSYKSKPSGVEIARIKPRMAETKPLQIDCEGFKKRVLDGYSFTPAVLSGGCRAENWASQQLFAVDIDNDQRDVGSAHKMTTRTKVRAEHPLTIDDVLGRCYEWEIPPLLIYETFSSTPEWLKFRIVFACDSPISDRSLRDRIQSALHVIFPECDSSCINPDRLFFGGKSVLYDGEGATFNYMMIDALGQAASRKPEHKVQKLSGKLEELKENFDFLSYLRTFDCTEKSVGGLVRFNPCPVCGHNDDFFYYPDSKTFHCFGASGNVGGSVIDFIIHTQKMDVKQAIKYFKTELCGIPEAEFKQEQRAYAIKKNNIYDDVLQQKLQNLIPERKFQHDDKGNGELFAEVFKDCLRYNATSKSWYFYNGQFWKNDIESMFAHRLAKLLYENLLIYATTIRSAGKQQEYLAHIQKLGNRPKRTAMIEDAKDKYFIENRDFNKNPYLFNCQNGTYDLEKGYFRRHDAMDFISKISNVWYDETAESPDFDKFMGEIMLNDSQKIRYLQKALGYALTGETSLETCFILYGATTRNGKSTLVETIIHMLGSTAGYAMSMVPETLATRKNRDSRSASGDIARLDGARFVNASEPPKRMVFDVALLKTLLGRDSITVRNLYEREFEFIPQFKLFINTNFLPTVTDDTLFSSGRLNVITFERHFTAKEQDKTLKDRLKSPQNLSGIFNWCVKGWNLFREEKLEPPASVVIATSEYRSQSDKFGNFISECLEESDKNCKAKDVYAVYQNWCQCNGYNSENKGNFMAELRGKGLLKSRGTVGNATMSNVVCGYQIAPDYLPDSTVFS